MQIVNVYTKDIQIAIECIDIKGYVELYSDTLDSDDI